MQTHTDGQFPCAGADPYEKILAGLSKPGGRAARRGKVALMIPPSPQLPTPGREFLISGPFEGFTAVATVVKKMGYGLKVVDCRPRGGENVSLALKEIADASVVGIAGYCDSFAFLQEMTGAIKKAFPDKLLFLGGPLVTSLPETVLENTSADCAMLGESELTVIEFLETAVERGQTDLSDIRGMALKTPGGVRLTGARPQIQDLDNLPFPDYTIWPNHKEIAADGQIIISTTRGCPCACSFCFKTIPALRMKSLERFEREVAYLKETTNFDYAWLNDLTFNVNVPRAMKVCDILHKYGVKYHCFARVAGVSGGFAAKLKRTGCQGIWFGIESYDQEVLDLNRKNTTIAQIDAALETASRAGLRARGLFIVGLPGETESSLRGMMEFIRKGDFIPLVKYLVPFPGTALYEEALKTGKITDTVEFLRGLSRRRVGDHDDAITNMTGLDESLLRDYFHRIWELTREKEAA